MFIAVNSGTSPAQVAAYVRSVKLPWPVIVDTSREFERRADVGEVSLKNIHQAAFITADGTLRRGRWSDIKGTIETALRGASWKIDPANIPDELRMAWRAVEFGNYAAGARHITQSLGAVDPQKKQAAESLHAAVKSELDKDVEAAWALGEQKKYFEAHQAMTRLQERFKGYEIPEKITDAAKWLASRDEVKSETAARKILDGALPLLKSRQRALRNRGLIRLRNVVKRYPDTEAAEKAQSLLDESGQ